MPEAGTYNPGDRVRVERAVADYAKARAKIHERGQKLDLDTNDNLYDAWVYLLLGAGVRDEDRNKFDRESWERATGESVDSPEFDTSVAVENLLQQRQDLATQSTRPKYADRGEVRKALHSYENARWDIHDRGGDLDGEDAIAARNELLAGIGVDRPDLFNVRRWRHVSGENADSPDINASSDTLDYLTREAGRMDAAAKFGDTSALEESIKGGQGLPSGKYEFVDDRFVRVGDAEELYRYHGTVVPEGTVIEKFKPRPANFDSENRPAIGNASAIYSSADIDSALRYAEGFNNPNEGQGQLYTLRIKPNLVADLSRCQDDFAAQEAIEAGFDVIECPQFWEQPETIVFNPDRIQVEAVYPIQATKDTRTYPGGTGDTAIDALLQEGYLTPALYRSGEGRRKALEGAVAEYERSNGNGGGVSGRGMSDKSMEYRGMPKEATYRARRGRGSMRY